LSVHELYEPGVVDHEPLLHVDDTATDEQADGEVTDDEVYDVHELPWAVTPQPPDAAQDAVHPPVVTPGGKCERNELNSAFVAAGRK
jgi:hypothetical protein